MASTETKAPILASFMTIPPSNVLTRVSEPFLTDKEYGSGLGLFTAFALVHSLSGQFTIENGHGGGGRVMIRLPIRHAPVRHAKVVHDDSTNTHFSSSPAIAALRLQSKRLNWEPPTINKPVSMDDIEAVLLRETEAEEDEASPDTNGNTSNTSCRAVMAISRGPQKNWAFIARVCNANFGNTRRRFNLVINTMDSNV